MHPPVGHHDVAGRRLERGGRQRSDLSLEPDGALMNRRSGDGRASTAERADRIGRLVRIAVEDADLLERDAERVGGKLGPRGLVTLAMRGRPGDDRDRPVEFQPGCGAILGKSRSLLDIGRDADALQSSFLSRGRLRATQPRVVRELDEPLEARMVIAAVVGAAGGVGVREVGRPNEIAEPDLNRVQVELYGEPVHHALDQESGFGTAGTSIRPGRGRVRIHGEQRALGGGDAVAARLQFRHDRGNECAVRLQVRAHVRQHPGPNREDGAIPLRRQFNILHLAPSVPGSGTIFGAFLDPFDGTPEPPGRGRHRDLFADACTLAAEATTHVLDDDTHVHLIKVEAGGDSFSNPVCRLG